MTNTRTGIPGCLVLCLLMLGGIGSMTLSAQSPAVQSDKLGWTQAASAADLAVLSFAVFVDGVRSNISGSTCTPTTTPDVHDCVAPFPAMTPGEHTIELIAIRIEGALVLESARSAPFIIRLFVAPATPTGLRIVR